MSEVGQIGVGANGAIVVGWTTRTGRAEVTGVARSIGFNVGNARTPVNATVVTVHA